MSQFEPSIDNRSASISPENVVKQEFSDTETLFERPTKSRHPQEVLRYGIECAALEGQTALFDVLPGIGKSRSVSKMGRTFPLSIFTNLRDNYEQFERWGEEDGVVVERLPTATHLCPVLRSENPAYRHDPIAREARDAHNEGWPVGEIHRELDLPCEDDTCPYLERVAEIDTDGLNSLVGHFTQAYNSAYVSNRVVVLDEEALGPYKQEIKNPVDRAEEFIATLEEFPFDGVPFSLTEDERQEAISALESAGLEPDDYRDFIGEFHAKAPLIAYALFDAEQMDNGIHVAHLPDERTAIFNNPHTGSLWLLNRPDFSQAEAVIALDATPCIADWKLLLGADLCHYRLFDDEQRNRYLREQGYEFIQLNNHVWPVSEGNVSIAKCEAYLREINREHDRRPDLITSIAIRSELKDRGLTHLWRDGLHYGALRGRNDIADSELLVVLGSPGRPDWHIQREAAFHGECAEPATDEEGERLNGHDLDYQSEVANDILESIRRGEVFQAAMRAGRTEDAEATIYIATGMLPDWLDTQIPGRSRPGRSFDACMNLRSEGEKEVIEALRGADGMSASEIAEEVDIGPEMAKKHRQTLQERGLIEKEGELRWARYSDSGLERINISGSVDLSLSGTSPYNDSIRGKYPIESRLIPRQELLDEPTRRYPAWMRDVQQRARHRQFEEQCKQRWRDAR